MSHALGYIVCCLLVVSFAVGLARGVQHRRDVDRRAADRRAYKNRHGAEQRERARAAVAQLVEHYFPFLRARFDADTTDDADPRDRLNALLRQSDGVQLGMTSIGFPAVLPTAERRKHLLVLGKSGFGKTTIMLALLQADLKAGRGICVAGAESELFRDLLGLVPPARARDVIYFKPADPSCTLSWNPVELEEGDDRALAAGELFSIFKRAVGEDSIGARADAILSSAFAVLIGRHGATLWSVARLLEDEAYRSMILADIDDPYLQQFWTKTFPEYPAGAILPISNRLNQFLRQPTLRAALCHPLSSFSIREALANQRVLFFDLGGLDPDASKLVAMMLLSKFQLELMRREAMPESERKSVFVHLDEFHTLASSAGAEGTWRELLARGRRYGLAMHLFTQHPNQLPKSLQHEIFGNTSSMVALNLSAADAAVVRRELLVPVAAGGIKPVSAEDLISSAVGEGYARLGSGACALSVKFAPPIDKPDPRAGELIREASWKTYAAAPVPFLPEPVPAAGSADLGSAHLTPVSPPESPTPGRGGGEHKLLQRLAAEWGAERGFRAAIEQEILGGAGRVDVGLDRGDLRIAVEVAVTSTPDQVAASVTKSFAAGFADVVVLSSDAALLKRVEEHVRERVAAADRDHVYFLAPDAFREFLDGQGVAAEKDGRVAGYRVHVVMEDVPESTIASKRRTLARLVGAALLRQAGPV